MRMRSSPSNTSSAAAEEEGDVRVLLGLGDAQLLQAGLCRQFAERVAQVVGREGDGRGQLRVVLGQADIGRQLRPAPAVIGLAESVNAGRHERSEERSVGLVCVRPCRYWWFACP